MGKVVSTAGTFLQINTGTESTPVWADFYDIKDYSGFGIEAETIDVTTLSAMEFTENIKGLKTLDNLSFAVNLDGEVVSKVNAFKNRQADFRIIFKQNGVYQRFLGEIELSIDDGAVNEAVSGTITITPKKMYPLAVEYYKDVEFTAPATDTAVVGAESEITITGLDPADTVISAYSNDYDVIRNIQVAGAVITYNAYAVGTATLYIVGSKLGYNTVTEEVVVTITES